MEADCTDYLVPALEPSRRNLAIKALIYDIKKSKLKFDAIAARGNSGIVMSSVVSHMLEKPLIIVRKPNEDSHGYNLESGIRKFKSYIIIDDLIASGATCKAIFKMLNKTKKCKGIFLYNSPTKRRQFLGRKVFTTNWEPYWE